jgi:hypothetical protein
MAFVVIAYQESRKLAIYTIAVFLFAVVTAGYPGNVGCQVALHYGSF